MDDQPAEQPGQHKPPFDLGQARTDGKSDGNPWLIILGLFAAVALILGTMMYNDESNPRLPPIGALLIDKGVLAGALLLAVGAICWQLRQNG